MNYKLYCVFLRIFITTNEYMCGTMNKVLAVGSENAHCNGLYTQDHSGEKTAKKALAEIEATIKAKAAKPAIKTLAHIRKVRWP